MAEQINDSGLPINMVGVQSSNLKAIGIYKTKEPNPYTPNKKGVFVIRVEFQRGASYDYWPCTIAEFEKGVAPGVNISEWFKDFKVGKTYSQV